MEASNGYNLHATVFYLTAFAIILPIQLSIGLQRGTYGFLSAMFAGTTLEILAYAARVLLCYEKNQYMMYLVPITIAPTFFSIAIYSSMPRIAGIYGRHILSVSPRTYTMTFVIANLLAMVLQAVGGVIAGFDNLKYSQHGLRIIQVGLAAHLLTMTAFLILTTIFAWNTYKQPWQRAKEYESLRHSIVFKAFILTLLIATLAIFVRTCCRIFDPDASLSGNNERLFLILDGAMVTIACLNMTMFHPGVVFRQYAEKGSLSDPGYKIDEK